MKIQEALAILADHQSLTQEQSADVMRQVMSGECSDAQIGALLMAWRIKGETADEIAGAAQIMRSLAAPVPCEHERVVDLVGTGGDGSNLFNVSTAATFVAAAAGVRMAKHGNRSVSSTSGSAEVLAIMGMPLDLTAEEVSRCVDEVGVGFMFAPTHHEAMRYAIGPRRDMGLRTIFNVLGPLTNPAAVRYQVIGVFDGALCAPLANVAKRLGLTNVMVVHSNDGLDEISLAAPTQVSELRNGDITHYTVKPEDLKITSASLDGLQVSGAQESAKLIQAALGNSPDTNSEKARALIALNAGAAIYVGGEAPTLADGVALAQDVIASGQAKEKLAHFIAVTSMMRNKESS